MTTADPNRYVALTGVTSLSNWAITDNGSPTAVTLSSFEARSSDPDLTLAAIGVSALSIIVLGIWGWHATRRRTH